MLWRSAVVDFNQSNASSGYFDSEHRVMSFPRSKSESPRSVRKTSNVTKLLRFSEGRSRCRNIATAQPGGLIAVLLDTSAEFGDRSDAAMDLSSFDEPAVEEALLTIVQRETEDEGIADSAGESLWEVWRRKGKYDAEMVARMHPAARKFFQRR